MDENKYVVRRPHAGPADLDRSDRRLLGLLAEDSSLSYAELGKRLNLSPSAVHDRVKRLRRDGVIRFTHAKIDGCRVGRTLLTFVLVTTRGTSATKRLLELSSIPDVEEIHTVAGDNAVMLKIRPRDTEALEDFLAYVRAIEGVEGTRSYIVLSTYLEREPSPEPTPEL
jgi:Lrp/AsnC family transcriptional regulator, leucine-responsive regulatory protein